LAKEFLDFNDWACLAFFTKSSWTTFNLAVGIKETFKQTVFVTSLAQFPTSQKEWDTCNANILLEAERLKRSGKKQLLFFAYALDSIITPDTLRKLGQLGFLRVNYCVDTFNQWFRHCGNGRFYDLIGVAQTHNMSHIKKYFPRVLFLPMAANPVKNPFKIKRESAVALIGTKSNYRLWLTQQLSKIGIEIEVLGGKWLLDESFILPPDTTYLNMETSPYFGKLLKAYGPFKLVKHMYNHIMDGRRSSRGSTVDVSQVEGIHLHGRIEGSLDNSFQKYSIILGDSHISGGWNRTGRCHSVQGRLRDFEVTAAGGFYMVQNHDDLDRLYKVGEEIETWETVSELKEKCEYYLKHPEKALIIAQKGHQRFLKDHTWTERFRTIIKELHMLV